MSDADWGSELAAVRALRGVSVFSAVQGGAYREHAKEVTAVFGPDAETRLGRWVSAWAQSGSGGLVILTGNAGTGKTAVAEAYCRSCGGELPDADGPAEVAVGRWVVKDLSGLPDLEAREHAFRALVERADAAQGLVCANEGVLRDTLEAVGDAEVYGAFERALRYGADRTESPQVTVVNVNRQRPTSTRLWHALMDYLFREELWGGCYGCPAETGGCPMRSNAEQLRNRQVREQLRTLVRLGTGEAVPTLRELLGILSWAVVGNRTCQQVKKEFRDRARDASTAAEGYFTRVVGGGLPDDVVERSPLLTGIAAARLGEVSDLQVDGWLRDSTNAPLHVRGLAGGPVTRSEVGDEDGERNPRDGLAGSRSPLDRIGTSQRTMTFHALGEMVSIDEDPARVEDGLDALVNPAGDSAAGQALWRQRVFFEGVDDLGGPEAAAWRLLDFRHALDLFTLAHKAAVGEDTILEVRELVQGLNFLVTGFSSPDEGLIVPDPSCLFARDPGSFRPASPSLVHSQVSLDRLSVSVPDRGLVEELLDVDHVEVDLEVDADPQLLLRIRPRMYEAVREAAEFQGPVGQGVAEMNDLRGFYGRLSERLNPEDSLRVADPDSSPPALVRVGLPHFAGRN